MRVGPSIRPLGACAFPEIGRHEDELWAEGLFEFVVGH